MKKKRESNSHTLSIKDDLEELDEAPKIEACVDTEAVAIALKVVPLVDINALRVGDMVQRVGEMLQRVGEMLERATLLIE